MVSFAPSGAPAAASTAEPETPKAKIRLQTLWAQRTEYAVVIASVLEQTKEKAAKAKEEKAKAAQAAGLPVDGSSEDVALPYRRTAGVGWKPLSKDWMAYVKQWKHLIRVRM